MNSNNSSDKEETNKSNKNALMQQLPKLKKSIEQNNPNQFKEIISSEEAPSLNQNTINKLLNKSFINYNQGNSCQKEIISFLLNYGANPNIKINFDIHNLNQKIKEKDKNPLLNDITPLMYSCLKGDNDLFKILMNNEKININLNDNEGKNCLFYLFYNFNNDENKNIKYEMAKEILENKNCKIDINSINNKTGKNILMESIIINDINFIKLILNYNPNINYINPKDGNTPIHYAIFTKNKEIIKLLLDRNCELNIKNHNQQTPVDLTQISNCETEIYSMLAGKFAEQMKEKSINNNNIINNEKYEKQINENEINKKEKNENYNDNNNSLLNEYIYQNKLKEIKSRIEIPFSFKKINNSEFYLENSKNIDNNNSFENKKSTPTLYIDLSDEDGENQLIIEDLKRENENISHQLDYSFENILEQPLKENYQLKQEYEKLTNELKQLNNNIEQINNESKKQEEEIKSLQKIIEQENNYLNILLSQEESLELMEDHNKIPNKTEYLQKKFSNESYQENYITQNLSKDILDFQRYNQIQMTQKQQIIKSLFSSIQNIIDSLKLDYQIQIYGSYATGLCLPWSELDLVLIPKKNNNQHGKEFTILQSLYITIKEINWIISSKFIENFIYPFITFQTDETFNNITVNISLQDIKHNGLKCVELTKQFMKNYTAFEPLIISLKQLLKISNLLSLIGKLNSYGLTLMIIFFLQIQISTSVYNINDKSNLGKLFFEFIKFYGMKFTNNYINIRVGRNEQIERETRDYLINHPTQLVIIDPLNHMNNVAERTFCFLNVKLAFRIAFINSNDICECSCHYLIGEQQKILELGSEHCILNKIFKTVKRLKSI